VDGRGRNPDAFALVERAPPQDRIMDDRQVDRPDEPVNCGDTPLPASLALSPRQADVTEVEEEEDEHRSQPSVPFPPCSPRRAAPDRSGDETDCGKCRAGRSDRSSRDRRERMPPDELANRRRGNPPPARHSEPGRRHVDVKDPDGLTLEIIRRGERQSRRHPTDRQRQTDQQQPVRGGLCDPKEPRRICKRMHRVRAYALPISFCAIASATAAGSRPDALLSAQICSSRTGIPSILLRTRLASPSPRYSVHTLMMPPALIT